MYRIRFLVLVGMVVVAAACRVVPHPWNFGPVGAMALFGGACFASRAAAFLVPLGAMFLGDLALGWATGDWSVGLHPVMPAVYGSFALVVCLGFWLRRRRRPVPIAAATLAGAVLFFVLSNLGFWVLGSAYPKTWDGLVACYVAAIPYFGNTLLGDAVYATLLFGGLALAEKGFPAVREPAAGTAVP